MVRAANVLGALLVLQIALGGLNVWLTHEYELLILAHLATATLLWGTLTTLNLQLFRIPAAAKRITETNQTVHRFLERYMATDPPAHAFTNENDRCVRLLPRLGQRVTMGGDQSRQRIGSASAFARIGVIKQLNFAHRFQMHLPALHPVMRRRRAGARSEKKERSRHPK